MAKICFKNVLEENVEFTEIDTDSFYTLVYEYAKTKDKETYTAIMQRKIYVYLNGEDLVADDWDVTLTDSDEIVITPAIEGEKAASVVQIIAGAILVVAGYVTFGTTAWKGAAMMATGFAGMFGGVSSLLYSPDLPSLPSLSGGKGAKETQTYSWSGIKTTAQLDSPIPIIYGTHAVGGNIISLFTEVEGKDNYLYMLLGLCEGEIQGICQEMDYTNVCLTSDSTSSNYENPAIYFDNQPLRNYDEVEWWYRTGKNKPESGRNKYYPFAQNLIPYFPSSRIQFDDGRELSNTVPIVYTTTKEVDMLAIRLEAPALYKVDEASGDIVNYEFKYKIEWRKPGDTWTALSLNAYYPHVTSTNANHLNLSISFLNSITKYGIAGGTYIIEIDSMYEDATFTKTDEGNFSYIRKIEITIKDESKRVLEKKVIEGNVVYNSTRVVSTVARTGKGGGGATSYETITTVVGGNNPSISIGDYSITLFYDKVKVGDSYTISSIQGGDTSSEFTVIGKSKTGIWDTKYIDFNEVSDGKGIYEIRLLRTDGGASSSFHIENRVTLSSVIEIVQGAFIYPNTALLGFRIRATNQLSGSPPNVVTVVKGKRVEVPDLKTNIGSLVPFENCFWDTNNSRWEDQDGVEVFWNDTSSWRSEYTENFMCCARDLLTNRRYGVGSFITTSNLNSADIIAGIKECHRDYYAKIDDDFVQWWNSGNDATWTENWFVSHTSPAVSNFTISNNASARSITVLSKAVINPTIRFSIALTRPIKSGQTYTVSITISDLASSPTDMYIYTTFGENSSIGESFGPDEDTPINSAGTYTWTFTASKSTSKCFLKIRTSKRYNYSDKVSLQFKITNFSIVKGYAPTGSTQDVTGVGGKEHFHSFNGVLESDKSALTALIEICEGFRCWPTYYGDTFSFVMDTDSIPVHTLSVANTKNFKQNFTPISEIPYRIIGQYTDESMLFEMRSVMIKTSSTDINEINEQTVGMKGLTDFNRVSRELKYKMDTVERCNHFFEADCDIDSIHCTAGDIIYIQDDLPRWGQGGRILDYTATNITLDKKYTFTNVATDTHVIRFQDNFNKFNTATVNMISIDNNASLQVIPIQNLVATPCIDSTYMIGKEDTDLKKFRLFGVSRSEENTITISGRNHISSLYGSPTFEVAEVYKNKPPSVLDRPLPLKSVLISQLTFLEGKGFNIGVKLEDGDNLTKEIVVQLDRTGSTDFETILTFSVDQRQVKYIDSSLKYDHDYTFRVFGRSSLKQSTPINITTKLRKALASVYVSPPSGFCIKDSNAHNFAGKDIVLAWNSVGSSAFSTLGILGYKIEVYHTIYGINNLLRSDYTSDTKYTYTLEMNEEDSARLNLDQSNYSVLYFRLYTIAEDNVISNRYTSLTVTNPNPPAVSSLEAESTVGGVNFSWNKSEELDHKYYTYRTKVGNTWGSWKNTDNNKLNRSLTATEIGTAGSKATIHFEVRDVDWYNHESVSASIVASANKISDNIYQLIPSVSGNYTGNVASLYDGVTATGNFIIV